jgi:hypothetical protein
LKESEIRSKLSSNELTILKQSLSFINEKLVLERSRSQRAEGRATAILAVDGILSGFVVHFAKLIGPPCDFQWLFLFSLYVGSILFLLKSALYSLKALWALKGNELTPALVFNMQSLSEIEALREETTWKIWEYYQLLPLGNERLFWTHRAQRNIFAAIIMFTILGMLWFLSEQITTPHLPDCIVYLLIMLIALFVVFLDMVLEKWGNLWH